MNKFVDHLEGLVTRKRPAMEEFFLSNMTGGAFCVCLRVCVWERESGREDLRIMSFNVPWYPNLEEF